MGIFNKISNYFWSAPEAAPSQNTWSGGNLAVFDGEKTPYEMGTPKDVTLDYGRLRMRAWEAYIKSDVIQNAIKKYVLWVVGAGLKLQASPVELVIGDQSFNNREYTRQVEAYFRIYANSKQSTYKGMETLHAQAAEAMKNAILSGDVLVVERYVKGNQTTEIIDGVFVSNPYNSAFEEAAQKRGNTIIQGVEVDSKYKHVAFYVAQNDGSHIRIAAKGAKTGRNQAWLMYGLKHKINDVRGMSLLTAVLETATKMDRYKEATIGTAEENAKIVYTIEHNSISDGSDPMAKQFAQSLGRNKGTAPETSEDEAIASKIAQTTEKQTYNLTPGATLNQRGGSVDIHFAEFFGINSDLIYSTIGMPPEVASDKFGGAYSGSRAALKSWEYKMGVERVKMLKDQFYKPIYDYWLDINVLNSNIEAPGYLDALMRKDWVKLEAYRNCRFIGVGVPHIDPLKEANAERKKLGSGYDGVPLTTGDQSAEVLNSGDFESIQEAAKREQEMFSEFVKNSNDGND